MAVTLRSLEDGDLERYFALESDQAGADMMVMLWRVPGDRKEFDQYWSRVREDPAFMIRTIETDGAFAGYALSYPMTGQRQVGYWIERELWGRGIATAALRLLLDEISERPLWGRVAASNLGSRRVLERAGFGMVATELVTDPRRDTPVKQLVLRLDGRDG